MNSIQTPRRFENVRLTRKIQNNRETNLTAKYNNKVEQGELARRAHLTSIAKERERELSSSERAVLIFARSQDQEKYLGKSRCWPANVRRIDSCLLWWLLGDDAFLGHFADCAFVPARVEPARLDFTSQTRDQSRWLEYCSAADLVWHNCVRSHTEALDTIQYWMLSSSSNTYSHASLTG